MTLSSDQFDRMIFSDGVIPGSVRMNVADFGWVQKLYGVCVVRSLPKGYVCEYMGVEIRFNTRIPKGHAVINLVEFCCFSSGERYAHECGNPECACLEVLSL